MNNLKVGFARTDITPCMGISIAGYFQTRIADGVLDPLEANAVAIAAGDKTALFISLDHCGIKMDIVAYFKEIITKRTGIPAEAIIISATHSHTAPHLNEKDGNEAVPAYREFVAGKLADAAAFALEDLKPARAGWKIGTAPNVAFIRRFRMKDGKVRTNPGVGNPDIAAPLGEVDERVNILRFDREGADTVVIMNFGNHPDVVGGCKISADWPGFARRTLERCLPGVKSLFINGAQGDVNHVNVKAKDGEMNDLANDFDDVARGYGHARHIGNVVAGAVMQVFDKVNYIDVDSIKIIEKTIKVPSNKAKAEDLPLAHKYNDLHKAGKDDEIPFKAMELTTVVAEAQRMVRLENGPDFFEMKMTGVAVGNLAFITIPGEGFTYIGRELKKAEGWALVLPCILSNGSQGYFPTQEAYDEGGYEARSSNFKAGVAEIFVEEGIKILGELRK
ncbi:MAG: hypothetical protein ACI4QW_00860 [Clostridia bacterium]